MKKLEKGRKLVGTVSLHDGVERIEGIVLNDYTKESNPQNSRFSFNDRFIEIKITKHNHGSGFNMKNEIITIIPIFRNDKILNGRYTFEIWEKKRRDTNENEKKYA